MITYGRLVGAVRRRLRWLLALRPGECLVSIQSYLNPELRNPATNAVLLVEPNLYHAETLPGYVALIEAAGYKPVLLTRPRLDVAGALSRLHPAQRPPVFTMSLIAMRFFLRSAAAGRFHLIFFNSATVAEADGFFGSIKRLCGRWPAGKIGSAVVEHGGMMLHMTDEFAELDRSQVFALRRLQRGTQSYKMLAPVEFGDVAPLTASSLPSAESPNPVLFLTVGRLDQRQRSLSGLAQAVSNLGLASPRPFRVIIIGAVSSGLAERTFDGLPIEVLGQLPFEKMFEHLERSHYFLPLLDTSEPFHQEYLDTVTSGSRQLILGFQKVAIWERSFAEVYGFSSEDSIIYEQGQLAAGMLKALQMTPDGYTNKRIATRRLKNAVFRESVNNLRALLQGMAYGSNGKTY